MSNTTLDLLAKMKKLPLCTFKPGKNVATGEEKFNWWLHETAVIKSLFGGNRCVHGDTLINGVPIREIGFLKGTDHLYLVGEKLRATLGHHVLTPAGWRSIGDLCQHSQPVCVPVLLDSTAEHDLSGWLSGDQRSWQTLPGFQADYLDALHSCDALLQFSTTADQSVLPSRDDALARTDVFLHESERSRPWLWSDLLSNFHALHPELPIFEVGSSSSGDDGVHSPLSILSVPLSSLSSSLKDSLLQGVDDLTRAGSDGFVRIVLWHQTSVSEITISSILPITDAGVHDFYDITMPGTGAYEADGLIHRNSGKTETGGFLFCCMCLGESLDTYIPYMHPKVQDIARKCSSEGSRDGWAASVSYSLQATGNQEKILKYIPEEQIASRAWQSKPQNILAQLTLKNGKRITFKSYEQGREDFQAAGVGVVWCDEEPPKDIWQEIGLRQAAGVTLYRILTMTPVMGITWVYSDIYLSNSPDITTVTVGWDDNEWLLPEQKRQMAIGLSEDELAMRRDGSFVKRQGLVYKDFSQSRNTVPADWEPELGRHSIYRSMDFGFAEDHPFVCLFAAVDTDGDCVIYDELYLRQTAQDKTCELVMERTQPYTARASWGDSARPDWIDYLTRNGIPTLKATKDVELGISKVTEWLLPNPVTGLPRLRISKRCTELIRQLESYSYSKKNHEHDRGKRLPEKKDDDGCFPAGTLILTTEGMVPIEQIMAGVHRVITPFGESTVEAAGMTGIKEVHTRFGIKATPDHKIITARGVMRLDELRYSDTITRWNEKQQCFKDTSTIGFPAIRKTTTSVAAHVLEKASSRPLNCTEWSMSPYMEQFLRDFTSTTRTETSPIMNPRTWFASVRENITYVTKTILKKSVFWLQPGINLMPAASGIENWVDAVPQKTLGSSIGVLSALPNTWQRIAEQPTAVEHANKPLAVPVWGLRTEHGMYVADNVLVKNCDALRYFVVSFTKGSNRDSVAISYSGGDSVTGFGSRLTGAVGKEPQMGYVSKKDLPFRTYRPR